MADKTADNNELLKIRHRIDAIDSQVLRLLNERAECAEEVAKTKRAESVDEQVCFYRPEREAQILRRMIEENPGPLRDEQITRIYRDIIASCLALEQCLQVAYLGPEGTFSQSAVHKHFGPWVTTLSQDSIAQVFQEVETGRAHYGVIPIENSTGGMVTHTLDTFMVSSLSICGEVHLRIHQNLMCKQDDWQNVSRVFSHQQSLAQCSNWLQKNLPDAELIPVSSNAEAARLASTEPNSAAVAGTTAAEIYGLKAVQVNIEDLPNNTTRFLIIGNQQVPPSGDDKTSLLITAKNQPGSLFHLLKPLAEHGLDMSRIESRPSKNANWEYVFFLDINGHVDSEPLKGALLELEQEAELMRVLGSYPRAVL